MKKFVQSALIFILLCSLLVGTVNASVGYNIGPREYALTSEYCVSKTNAEVSDGSVVLAANGSVTYDFYLIFNAASVTFSYTVAEDTEMTVDFGNAAEYGVILPAAATTATLTFTDAAGESYSEPKGERCVTLTAAKTVTLQAITFNKETIQTIANYDDLFLCDLSEEEQAIETTVIIDQRASVLLVNGAKRYINNDASAETALTYNGRIYLPVHTLARALSYYYEDVPEKMYTLMRHDEFEFCFTPTESYKQVFGEEKRSITDPRIYKDGETYLPLRMFAEATGETVGYKNGVAVIDDKFTVKKVLNSYYDYVDGLFSPFRAEEAEGTVYHVAQSAASGGSGSAYAPFKKLAEAAAVAEAGDTVIVHAGTYRETLTPQNNGTATAPIIFQAAEGEQVILSAAEQVSGFTAQENGIYTAPVSWDLGDGRNQVFYQGDSLVEARYPNASNVGKDRAILIKDDNEPYSPLWPIAGDFSVAENEDETSSVGSKKVTSETLLNQEEEDYWKGAYFVSMHGSGYALHNARVAASKKGELTLTNTSKFFWPPADDDDKLKYGYLAGHLHALDAAGEWVLQDGTLYLIPPEGADTANLTVEVKRRQCVADLSNAEYVQLKGFSTIGGSIKMNNSKMCVLNGLNMSYLNHYIIGIDQHSGFIDDANVRDANGAPTRGEVGIYVGGSDNAIVNCSMSYAAAAAVYGVGQHIYIENNVIKECGYAGSYVAGLFFTSEAWKSDNTPRGGHSIYGNTVYRAGRSVLQFTRAAEGALMPHMPSEIAYNDFHDGTLASLDTGITYAYWVLMGHEKLFTAYHHNYVYYTLSQQNPHQMGIFHDGGTENVNVYNNVVFTTSENTWFNGATLEEKYRDIAMPKYGIFSALAEASYSHCPKWNNSVIDTVAGGPKSLKTDQFPDEKPFYAGVGQNTEGSRVNCEAYFN